MANLAGFGKPDGFSCFRDHLCIIPFCPMDFCNRGPGLCGNAAAQK